MIATVVVGYGLAGQAFHCPLVRRQPGLRLHGIVARDPDVRAQAVSQLGNGVRGYAHLDEALADPDVKLVVIATPHDTHARLTVRTLEAGRHCVVDKVMALATAEADAMIAARDRSGCLLSVFHNRRWDWDFLTVRELLAPATSASPCSLRARSAVLPRPEPGVAAWPRPVRFFTTGAHHLVDQALQLGLGPCRRLTAWVIPAPWEAVDTGGHGRIVLEFDGVIFQVESSRICWNDRPRWWIIGTHGGFVKHGIDPQESALRSGNIDAASEPPEHQAVIRRTQTDGSSSEFTFPTIRGHWDSYYQNIALAIEGREPLAVTAEQAREVVRVLDAAVRSAHEHKAIEGPWG